MGLVPSEMNHRLDIERLCMDFSLVNEVVQGTSYKLFTAIARSYLKTL